LFKKKQEREMLNVELDTAKGIAVLKPDGALSESDFELAAGVIDPYLESHGELKGLIISTRNFPGWESFGALAQHFKFVKDHHKNLSYVALVTDSKLGNMAEKIAGHFVSAEIRHFPYDQFGEAEKWILDDEAGPIS
jgi:hypothetical protein